MAKFNDITGKVFGRLVVLNFSYRDKHKQAFWRCLCECGTYRTLRGRSLVAGATKSCGCLNHEVRVKTATGNKYSFKHGLTHHPLYRTWCTMKQRCYNTNNIKYRLYGERGIQVCHRWLESFTNFLEDMGERPTNRTLGRINNDGDYCKENCRWETFSEQNQNRRKYKRKGLFNEVEKV